MVARGVGGVGMGKMGKGGGTGFQPWNEQVTGMKGEAYGIQPMGLEWHHRVTDGSYTCGKHRVTQLSNHYVVQNK